MTVYESCIEREAPLYPMGNGKMLVYLSGAAIHSLHCGYLSPSHLSLSPDFSGGYYESESERLPMSSARRHRIWYSASAIRSRRLTPDAHFCDLLVTDFMATDEGLFLRMIEGEAPFRWKLELPDYVSAAVLTDYHLIHCDADALFCTIPAGRGCSITTAEEVSLNLYLCGDLRFEEDGRAIVFDGGRGYMLWVDSRQPTASLKLADRLLTELRKGSAPTELSLFGGANAERLAMPDSADRYSAKLEDAVAALLAMQSDEGFILADAEHPYAFASDLPLLTAALLKLGRCDLAWKMIECWANSMGSVGEGIAPIIGSAALARGSDSCDGGATAEFLLAAILLIEADGENALPDALEALCRKLRKAFTLTMNCFTDGMLPFSVVDACFEAGMLSRDCIFHGSAAATAMAIAGAERYIAYCEHSGRKIARESERYLSLLAEARASFERHFGKDQGLFMLNSPEMEEKTRRPRFMRGICNSCATTAPVYTLEQLELSRAGHYRCRRCLARADKSASASCLPIPSIDATAVAALWMPSPISDHALDRAAAYYRASIEREDALPLRRGADDAMLLAAARRSDCAENEVNADAALFQDILIETAALDADPHITLSTLPTAWAEASAMKGSACHSASIAAMILGLCQNSH